VGRLDAEDLGELEEAFHQGCVEVVQQHGGTVNLYVNGEVFACFGCPRGGEDDAERAVRAALRLAHTMPERLQRALPHLALRGVGARVGLDTGRMVLDTRALQGEAPKVVSWLASQAGPGEVLAGETAWKQVRGAFETEDLGLRDFPGLAGPARLALHRVLRERDARLRFERTRVPGGLTPLVGRERELRRLLELWERAREGQGAFVLLRGEAGLGKSRLLQELHERVPAETATRLRFQCGSRLGSTAPSPLAEVLQSFLQLAPGGSPSQHLRELEAELDALGLPEEHGQLLGLLLSLPIPEGAPVYRLTPERRRDKTYEALVAGLLGLTRLHPVLVLVEDLHWADSSWLEFLGVLSEHLAGARLLVVLSARPEFQPSWPSRAQCQRFDLERLPAGLAAALVKEVAHAAPLPEETVRELVGKTDGVPLFIEEMTRMVLEGGSLASIPATLHELLLARLDLLPSRRKTLAQLCAVVGRDFSLALLEALTGREPTDLRRELLGLVEAGLLQEDPEERGAPGYRFRHALFLEAAYQSLPRGERKRHHQRIARVLEERFPAVAAARPEVLAHHDTEAGELARAIPSWGRAAQLAFHRLALPEVVSHFTRALELLWSLPETRRPPVDELGMLTSLGVAQAVLRGWDAPEVARTYARSWELLRREGAVLPQRVSSYWHIYLYHRSRAEALPCHELSELLLHEGERQRSPALLASGHAMRASDLTRKGRTRSALVSCERALVYAGPGPEGEGRSTTLVSGLYDAIASLIRSAAGRLEQARENDRKAQALARRLGSPFALWLVLTQTARACMIRRDVQEALRLADELMVGASERSYWVWPLWAKIIRGWALAELGQPREGLVLVAQEVSRWRALGLPGERPHGLAVLARLHLQLGQVREGLEVVHEALALVEATGERVFEAGLRHVRGELLRVSGRAREARCELIRAIVIARQQGNLLFELCARVGLGRLLRDTGHPEAARRVVVRGLSRFGAGEDSADLRDARALLEDAEHRMLRRGAVDEGVTARGIGP
jgi:tetratricopeptide (TPR) repeat protein